MMLLQALIISTLFSQLAFAEVTVFDHAFHAKKIEISCSECHGRTQPPKVEKSLCHSCHKDQQTSLFSPLSCNICHANFSAGMDTAAVKPLTHNSINFSKKHGELAIRSMQVCLNCHTENSCSACHNQFRSITKNPHPPHFITTHGLKAKFGLSTCTQCHKESTCTACHSK